ncbi:MAG: M28 family peptidase [Phycisphaerales bacterium]
MNTLARIPLASRPGVRTVAAAGLVAGLFAGTVLAADTDTRSAMDGDASPIADALAEVDDDVRIFDLHLSTLANPWMEGRVPGSKGMERAKEYFEDHLRQFGLEAPFPVEGSGVDGSGRSYRQAFDLGGSMEVTGAELAALTGGKAMNFEAGTDFNVMGLGGSGDITGGVTFVGYGIENGPEGYSNFADDTDLEGEIAMMFRFEPMNDEGRSQWTEDGRWSRQAGFNGKVRSVLARGAAGIIIVNPPGADDPRASTLIEAGGGGNGRGSVPVMMMSSGAADAFLARADEDGRTLMDLREMADDGMTAMPLDGILSMNARLERTAVLGENVGGMLRGKGDLADEYVVIGGHLDHLGMGYFGSRAGAGELHPGADDNASGSAGILLIAQRMAEEWEALGDTPRRSVILVGFDGEESGLNGSRYYANNPIAPIEDHVLMMNFDMIGRILNGRLSLSGANTGEGLAEWIEPYVEATPLTVVQPQRMSGASDHTSFFRQGVPVLFAIIADFHDDYHTPADTAWKINRVGATHAARLFHDIGLGMALKPDRIAFADSSSSARPRRGAQASAESSATPAAPAAPAAGGPAMSDIRVRFGIRPGTYDPDVDGIQIAGVTEGGSAAEAGVQDGDILVRWDGQKITNVEEWMVLLARHDPGDTVKIGVKRGDEEITLDATLQARGG